MRFNITFSRPSFGVNGEGFLTVLFPNGTLYGTCMNANSSMHGALGNMVFLTFANVTAKTTLAAESVTDAVNITMNVTELVGRML